MKKILTTKEDSQDMQEKIERASAQYPVFMQDTVREAFQAADEEDFEEAEDLCRKLLEYQEAEDIRMLLGVCYFRQEKMERAEQVFQELVRGYPDTEQYRIYLGIAYHARGDFYEAVKELERLDPLSTYHPFFYTSYGDSLQQIGRMKQSREAFRREVDFFEKTGIIPSDIMLDGAFQNLLHLDVVLANGKYPEDVESYFDFLDQVEMTEDMQECLSVNIVYFSTMMSNKWFRPLFLEFVTRIRDKGYLKKKESLEVLESAFTSWESYGYHEDRRVSALMESYLEAVHERKYTLQEVKGFKEEENRIEVTALTYCWYMCQYAAEHLEEIDYIREAYPHSYADNAEFFQKVLKDPSGTAEKIEKKLQRYTRKKTSRKELRESLFRVYKKACEQKKEPVYLSDGEETYRRMQPKVGRNDPCPCGSGKKYKKCCGR